MGTLAFFCQSSERMNELSKQVILLSEPLRGDIIVIKEFIEMILQSIATQLSMRFEIHLSELVGFFLDLPHVFACF